VAILPRHRTVADVMTVRVHVASPLTPFKLLVRLIEENRISAVPVVNQQGVPVGVVSESDLLLKESRVAKRHEDRVKTEATIAADLMTSPPITVRTDALIADAARLMQERNVRRLVVVDARGRIAGIVSRSDLLQIFLRTDEDLREEIIHGILPAIVPNDARTVDVDVRSNVITLAGEVDRRSDVEILIRMARDIDGAVYVVNRLRYRWDDLKQTAGAI
jgi:CBS domain-containing protein